MGPICIISGASDITLFLGKGAVKRTRHSCRFLFAFSGVTFAPKMLRTIKCGSKGRITHVRLEATNGPTGLGLSTVRRPGK